MIDASDLRVSWTAERVARLRELSARGLSARQIGIELGVSRNAVISKANRIGLGPRRCVKSGPKPKHPPGPKKRTSGLPKPVQTILTTPATEPIRFMDLKPHHCRWPLGDELIMFCGVPKLETGSYCAYHTRLSCRSTEGKAA